PSPSTTPTCRSSRPSSPAVRMSIVSWADFPSRSSARPSGPYRGFAYDWVAIAPTCGSAHGTTEPTARNFDCTATPHCEADRSHATIEYVATTSLRPVRELTEIDAEQVSAVRRDDCSRDLGARQRLLDRLRRRGAH